MVSADARAPSWRHERTHNTHPRDPPAAAQPLGSHACRRQRGPGSLLRDPPRRLPRRLRRPHPPGRGRHPHLRRRGARHARRGQGGLDRHGGAAQPARPPVAADRARPPRRGGRHPAVAGDAVARRRLVVAVPDRRCPDPLDHAAAGGRPGDGREGARGGGLAPRATGAAQASASSSHPSSRWWSSPPRSSWPCSTCTSAAASATAPTSVTSTQELRDDYRLGIGSLELDLSRAAAPAGRDARRRRASTSATCR